jgi:hypothetical protein
VSESPKKRLYKVTLTHTLFVVATDMEAARDLADEYAYAPSDLGEPQIDAMPVLHRNWSLGEWGREDAVYGDDKERDLGVWLDTLPTRDELRAAHAAAKDAAAGKKVAP